MFTAKVVTYVYMLRAFTIRIRGRNSYGALIVGDKGKWRWKREAEDMINMPWNQGKALTVCICIRSRWLSGPWHAKYTLILSHSLKTIKCLSYRVVCPISKAILVTIEPRMSQSWSGWRAVCIMVCLSGPHSLAGNSWIRYPHIAGVDTVGSLPNPFAHIYM